MKYVLFAVVGFASVAQAAQPSAPKPIPAPLRDLRLGTLNFLHTTDTHGWHAGHLLEAQYGADWGDYIDFTSHLRGKIEADGNDLLIIDTGDRVEGNGLYDASDPTGKYTFPIFEQQHMDVITTGNHELYKQNSSVHDFKILVPAYGDAYLSANINITDPDTGKFVPLANRFRKFTTKNQKIRILAFGFLFDFNKNFNNTIVQPVAKTLLEPWFTQALNDKNLDLIIVTAHAAARSDELTAIYRAIRAVHPDLPLQFFAGHQHIRDYKKFDDKAYVLASGRFMETIGFQSINGIQGAGKSGGYKTQSATETASNLTYFRRYIDNNLYSYYHHTGTNASTFHSSKGRAVSAQIARGRSALDLDKTFGCAPSDFWVSRVPFPSPNSIFTWLNNTVLPSVVTNPARNNRSRIILFNSGTMRFDIFQGAFTTDEIYIISPFTNAMHYIPDMPVSVANLVAPLLNKLPQVLSAADIDGPDSLETYRLAPPQQRFLTESFIPSFHAESESESQHPLAGPGLQIIPGYTTSDDAGQDGDDTIHKPVAYHIVPNIIASYVQSSSAPASSNATVDLVFNQYLDWFVLSALLQSKQNYTFKDIRDYMPGESFTSVITKWMGRNWKVSC